MLAERLHLAPGHREMLEGLLREHLPDVEVWAYGSRVSGRSHDGSDLDLVLRAHGLLRIESTRLAGFREALRQSNLPFLVEARDWARLPPRFHREIEREHVVLVGANQFGSKREWREANFGECALLIRDSAYPEACEESRYIGLEHIGAGSLSLLGHGKAGDVESVKSRFRCGDILFGKLRPYFRKVVRARFDGICSTDIWVVRPCSDVLTEYLFYVMASQRFVDFAIQGAEGTRMPRAQWNHTSRFQMRVPPLSEQRAIGDVLGVLDERIEVHRRMNQTLEAMAQALFKDWFIDFGPTRAKTAGHKPYLPKPLWNLFPNQLTNSKLGQIPEGWTYRPVSDFATIKGGKQLTKDKISEHEMYPVFGGAGIMGYTDSYNAEGYVISVGRVGAYCGQFFSYRGRAWINNNASVISSRDETLGEWLFLSLKHLDIDLIKKGAAQPFVSNSDIASMMVVFPGACILEAFRDTIADCIFRTELIPQETRTLADLRDTLLPNLISGKIRTHDAKRQTEKTL